MTPAPPSRQVCISGTADRANSARPARPDRTAHDLVRLPPRASDAGVGSAEIRQTSLDRAGVPGPDLVLDQHIVLCPLAAHVADLLDQVPPQDPHAVPDTLISRQAPAQQPARSRRTGAMHMDRLRPGPDLRTPDLRPG